MGIRRRSHQALRIVRGLLLVVVSAYVLLPRPAVGQCLTGIGAGSTAEQTAVLKIAGVEESITAVAERSGGSSGTTATIPIETPWLIPR